MSVVFWSRSVFKSRKNNMQKMRVDSVKQPVAFSKLDVTKLVTTRHRRLSNLLSMRVCGIGSVFKSRLEKNEDCVTARSFLSF